MFLKFVPRGLLVLGPYTTLFFLLNNGRLEKSATFLALLDRFENPQNFCNVV